MRIWTSVLGALVVTAAIGATAAAQDRMSPELLWKLNRLSGGTLSPDGVYAIYGQRSYELAENKGDTEVYAIDMKTGETFPALAGPESPSSVQWSDTLLGIRLFYVAKTDAVDAPQAWALDPSSGEVIQVTHYEDGISNLKVSPNGLRIAFTRSVMLDSSLVEKYPDLPHANAKIIDGLLYRHWDHFQDGTYSHLFVADLGRNLSARQPTDLMDGLRYNCPVPPFGGDSDFNWAPDGSEIAFTMKLVNRPAESTDTSIFVKKIGSAEAARNITTGRPGYDNEPVYSPDGKSLAWHSMARAGFESDRNRLMLMDRQSGAVRELSEGLDQQVHGATFSPDGQWAYFGSEWRGSDQIFRLSVADGSLEQVTQGAYNWSLRDIGPDSQTLLVARQNMLRPWELGKMSAAGGEWSALTDLNGEIYTKLQQPKLEERWVPSTDGKKIHCWVIYPPGFDPAKKYPLVTYCQGGPQGQIGQWFSYRWNFHLMAAAGYVIVAPNRRGLPGFGREWNDQISQDWGGQAMQDILSTTDSMLTESFVDKDRVAAIGASFGGYTVYWLMGNHEGRFATMIAHAGLFNLESFYGSTEELFFANWDIGGAYWESAERQKSYDFHSPHRYVDNWRTPLMVIHGQKDYRVPVTQGMEAFTAAQLKGVPSRFVYFPEENHWILSPQNGVLWHRLFFDWLGRTCSPEVAGG